MGMPISNYTVLSALAQERDGHERAIALDALRPFNLFAFLIHDPKIHHDFDRRLTRLFDELDYVTGDKLLFFALVDPPEEWLAHGSRRDYYSKLSNWQTRELLDPRNSIQSTDKGITAISLASSLAIL